MINYWVRALVGQLLKNGQKKDPTKFFSETIIGGSFSVLGGSASQLIQAGSPYKAMSKEGKVINDFVRSYFSNAASGAASNTVQDTYDQKRER